MDRKDIKSTPAIVQETIDRVIRKMRYSKKVRADVRAELAGHFEDALADCRTERERLDTARRLVEEFGDTGLLARLIRRAKKRCRPLWVRVMIRTFQVAGLCVLYVILCVSRLYIGKPTIKVDLVDHINQTVQGGQPDELNAWPGVQQAISLLAAKPDGMAGRIRYRDVNESQRPILDRYIQDNTAAYTALEQAVCKPCCWRYFDPVSLEAQCKGTGSVFAPRLMETVQLSAGIMDQLMPALDQVRAVSFALDVRRQRSVYQGRADAALADVVTLFRLGRLQAGSGLLIEQLVGHAILGLAVEALLETLYGLEIEQGVLARTYEEVFSLLDGQPCWIDLTVEKALQEDLIQRGFTDDGHGNGRMLSSGVLLVIGTPRHWWKDLLLLDFPDRQEVRTALDRFFTQMQQWNRQTPWDCRDQSFQWNDPAYSTLVEPAYERVGQIQWRTRAGLRAGLTVLAIKRYQAREGILPEDLDILVAEGLLNERPRDFYGPGNLTYQRRSDQEFYLYSRGEDLEDDQGMPATNDQGRPKRYGSHGDWVFWPTQP